MRGERGLAVLLSWCWLPWHGAARVRALRRRARGAGSGRVLRVTLLRRAAVPRSGLRAGGRWPGPGVSAGSWPGGLLTAVTLTGVVLTGVVLTGETLSRETWCRKVAAAEARCSVGAGRAARAAGEGGVAWWERPGEALVPWVPGAGLPVRPGSAVSGVVPAAAGPALLAVSLRGCLVARLGAGIGLPLPATSPCEHSHVTIVSKRAPAGTPLRTIARTPQTRSSPTAANRRSSQQLIA
jgi:hypothetical protein